MSQPTKIPLEHLLEVYGLIHQVFEGSPERPKNRPTKASLQRIRSELKVQVPEPYVRLARSSPYYEANWFASIGEDYTSARHILELNKLFRQDGLSRSKVMFNMGFDGDCDCWDLEQPKVGGEHPILHTNVDVYHSRGEQHSKLLASSFREYLQDFCIHQVCTVRSRRLKRRVKDLLEIDRQQTKRS